MRRQVFPQGTIADDDELSTDFRHLHNQERRVVEFVGQKRAVWKDENQCDGGKGVVEYVVVWEEQLGRNVH